MTMEYDTNIMTKKKLKIVLAVCPVEGEVCDRVTHETYKKKAVKYLPLGLLSIGANIIEHEIIILDASSRNLTIDQTLDEIDAHQPDILGLSVVTYRAWAMKEILQRTNVPVKVVGGPHTTHNYQVIKSQGADAVFVGDAEKTFPQWLEDGCPEGIFFGEPADLNSIPLPARELVDIEDYAINNTAGLLFDVGRLRLPMFSSKGCPHKCIYCDVQQKKYVPKNPQRIFEEFCQLRKMGATSIHIIDDTFNIDKKRVIDFCDLLVKNNFHMDWSVRGNVEPDEFVIKALSDAGCKRFHVGIEHLDNTVLKYFQKSHRLKQIENFCDLCKKYNIIILGYFIIGAPGETQAYRENLPKRIDQLGIQIPYFNVFTPLADTQFYRELLKKGVFKIDFWKKFSQNPVKNFQIPSYRTLEEEQELQKSLSSYLMYFGSGDKTAEKDQSGLNLQVTDEIKEKS